MVGPENEGIEEVGSGLSLSVEWTGVASSTRKNWIAGLPSERRSALKGVIKELLLNVEKHAGTEHVTIDVQAADGAIELTVIDRGAGFVTCPKGRGLTESVYRRANEVGIDVQISSVPGHGTRPISAARACQRPLTSRAAPIACGALALGFGVSVCAWPV